MKIKQKNVKRLNFKSKNHHISVDVFTPFTHLGIKSFRFITQLFDDIPTMLCRTKSLT